MIRINLLPYRAARKKENVRRQTSVFFLSTILVVLGIFLYNNILNRKMERLETSVASLRNEVVKYRKINLEIAEIKKKLAVLDKKLVVIKQLDSDRKAPIALLEMMTEVIVEKKMWFTSLNARENEVKIKGVALDNQIVADFMTRLESTKLFSSVNLTVLVQEKVSEDIHLKGFEIVGNKLTKQPANAGKPG
ncbi:MAG: PilN domain-containing protein [Desulfobacterales bacterium]|nr:PilN domain-containing protein [Desulfobacterales bacterium]